MEETANTAANTIATLIKSPQNDRSQPIGCSFWQQVTGAFLAVITEDFAVSYRPRLLRNEAVDAICRWKKAGPAKWRMTDFVRGIKLCL
jgi:hypothetical protein